MMIAHSSPVGPMAGPGGTRASIHEYVTTAIGRAISLMSWRCPRRLVTVAVVVLVVVPAVKKVYVPSRA